MLDRPPNQPIENRQPLLTLQGNGQPIDYVPCSPLTGKRLRRPENSYPLSYGMHAPATSLRRLKGATGFAPRENRHTGKCPVHPEWTLADDRVKHGTPLVWDVHSGAFVRELKDIQFMPSFISSTRLDPAMFGRDGNRVLGVTENTSDIVVSDL